MQKIDDLIKISENEKVEYKVIDNVFYFIVLKDDGIPIYDYWLKFYKLVKAVNYRGSWGIKRKDLKTNDLTDF